jgi:prephenate dehydrogenase
MTVQIAIIGLGQIGASFGLALSEKKDLLVRIGHDKENKVAKQAEKIGVVDRVESNLPKAVRGSELVLLCLPLNQIRETLEIIGPELKEGAVVMETGLAKEVVATWMGELLPPDRYYVGLTPVLNPLYLHEFDTGIEAARADLFKSGLMGIVAPPQTDSRAIKLAADLTRLAGANPLFADPVEIDGLMASTHLLPQLLAAAMLNATIDQPGWREARKVAGRAYAEVSEPVMQLTDVNALSSAAVMNRENILRMLDSLIAALHGIRGDIDSSDPTGLGERLERARQGRLQWWNERQVSDWTSELTPKVELPENPGVMGRLFGLGRTPKKSS